MSRIGKLPIPIPDKVEVKVGAQEIRVKGPLGELSQTFLPTVSVRVEGKEIICERVDQTHRGNAYHGLYRALIANMVHGVSEGFKRELDIIGVGYKAEAKGDVVVFSLGHSHPIEFQLPPTVKATVEPKTNHITLTCPDKQLVGQVAANMRALRAPEPYKGKGVRYTGETVRLKAGKAGGK